MALAPHSDYLDDEANSLSLQPAVTPTQRHSLLIFPRSFSLSSASSPIKFSFEVYARRAFCIRDISGERAG